MVPFQVATWSSHSAKVKLLLLFGDHIVSVDVLGNMFLWAFKGTDENLVPFAHIMLDDKFSPSCIMHPDTYLNKVNKQPSPFRTFVEIVFGPFMIEKHVCRFLLGVSKVLCNFGMLARRKIFLSLRDGIHQSPVVFHPLL